MKKKDVDFNKIVGDNIKKMRKKAKIAQDEFAFMMDLTRSNICNIEAGQVAISVNYLMKMALLLKCDISEIMPKDYVFTFPDFNKFKAIKLNEKSETIKRKLAETIKQQEEIMSLGNLRYPLGR